MKRLKILGVALFAILSLGVTIASVAQAVETLPKLLPAGLGFSFKSKVGEITKLSTLGGKSIECEKVTGSGEEAANESLGKVEFKFEKCKDSLLKTTCTGLSDTAGNITVKNTEWHLRHLLKPEEAFVNIVILVPAGSVHFSCLGILFTVEGCVASMDILTLGGLNAVNLLLSDAMVNFLTTNGDPNPLSVDTEDSLGMENCELKTKQENQAAESSGQSGTGEIEKCEAGGKECTFLIELAGTV